MRSIRLRRAIAIFLPVAVLATLCCGLVYLAMQQDLRSGANDPQLQLAEDAARALDGGAQPSTVIGASKVDVAQSLAPFVVVFDPAGRVLATDGQLDGQDPFAAGVLEHARVSSPNIVTWQPRPGLRVATVTVPWQGGTVLAGRSLREVGTARGPGAPPRRRGLAGDARHARADRVRGGMVVAIEASTSPTRRRARLRSMRVVSLLPSATEIIVRLGLADRSWVVERVHLPVRGRGPARGDGRPDRPAPPRQPRDRPAGPRGVAEAGRFTRWTRRSSTRCGPTSS